MKIDKDVARKLKKIVQTDEWDAVVKALDAFMKDIDNDEVSGTNAFETLRALHKREGRKSGLKEFFEAIEQLNFN